MKHRKQVALATVLALLVGFSPGAWAKTLSVTNTQAQGQKHPLTVKVWPGYGLNISYIDTGESIIKAWLDDPSRLAMDLDGKDGAASVLHLRRIKADPTLALMTSQDGATLLTVITESEKGRKLYQMKVIAADGVPDYYAVNVGAAPYRGSRLAQLPRTPEAKTQLPPQPDSVEQNPPNQLKESEPEPKIPVQAVSPQPQPEETHIPKPEPQEVAQAAVSSAPPKPPQVISQHSSSSIDDANAAAYGLLVAHRKGQIKRGSPVWYRVQSAISWLRRGKSRDVAARLAGVKLTVMQQVIAWGQVRPGRAA